ncbi:MAG: hypothetical protein V3V97_06040 [Hyphomicrobiaceae bacterium]
MSIEPKQESVPHEDATDACPKEQVGLTRRDSLKEIGKYAAYVAPAMIVLIPGETNAHHKPYHHCPPGQSNKGRSPC